MPVFALDERNGIIETAQSRALGTSSVYAIAFAADGSGIAAGGTAPGIAQWLVDPALASKRPGQTGDPITHAEWQLYLPNYSYRPPCPGARTSLPPTRPAGLRRVEPRLDP